MVKGQLISLSKGTLTMEELLTELIQKTTIQCAEDHRLIVAALNGNFNYSSFYVAFISALIYLCVRHGWNSLDKK